MIRTLSTVACAAFLLVACASTPPQTAWASRADANFTADHAACVAEANEADMRNPDGYAASHTGAAAAAALMLDLEDIRGGGRERLFVALRDACMIRKGWTKAG